MNSEEQNLLLKIVKTWRPSEAPEYRGFRCADCQKYKNIAWYHWLDLGGYKLPVHLCRDGCEQTFQNHNLNVDKNKRKSIDLSKFGIEYSEKAQERFEEIVSSWQYPDPELKRFFCDDCGRDLDTEKLSDGSMQRQGYHVWWKIPHSQILAELHFHRNCGKKLGI